ncbi:hypothetical protein COY52_11565, partial [Candidatus Desantisbacteria bacterium CG_4_10_14_0_8_um_filter_48_22]
EISCGVWGIDHRFRRININVDGRPYGDPPKWRDANGYKVAVGFGKAIPLGYPTLSSLCVVAELALQVIAGPQGEVIPL